MDFDFSDYSKVVYDTNCIIYYRLDFTVRFRKKNIRLTPKEFHTVNRITSQFLNKNYEIHTLRTVFDEILRKGIATIIEEYLTEKYRYLKRIGLLRIVIRRFEIRATKSVEELRNKDWFCIVDFSPSKRLMEEIKDFYRSLPDSPAKRILIDKNKASYPGDVDISLIIYSKEIDSPLFTNDRDIYEFKRELEANNYCAKIVSLPEVVQNSFS